MATVGTACGTAAQRSTLLPQAEHVKAQERPMRLSLYEYSYLFARRVERAAGRIVRDTQDPKVTRAALEWKRSAAGEIQRVAFQEDVLVGVLDAWAFALQQQQFFEAGAGRAVFGDAQPIARATSLDLVQAVETMVKPWGDDIAMKRGYEVVRSWARDNPIEDLSFTRRSIAALYADQLEGGGGEHGMPQSLANIEASVEDLMQRTALYAAQAPRQASWEGEALLDDLLEKPRVAATFEAVGSMRGDLSKMTDFTSRLPRIITNERLAAFASVADERRILLSALEETLERERTMLLEDAHEMLGTALDAIAKERQAAMRDMPAAAAESLRATRGQLEALVDRLLWGLFGIICVIGAVAAAGFFWFTKGRSPRQRHPPEGLPRRDAHLLESNGRSRSPA
jgi:hypothetical protein